MNLTDFNIPLIFYTTFIMVVWFESDIVITTPQYSQANNPYTPNMIWAFTLKQK